MGSLSSHLFILPNLSAEPCENYAGAESITLKVFSALPPQRHGYTRSSNRWRRGCAGYRVSRSWNASTTFCAAFVHWPENRSMVYTSSANHPALSCRERDSNPYPFASKLPFVDTEGDRGRDLYLYGALANALSVELSRLTQRTRIPLRFVLTRSSREEAAYMRPRYASVVLRTLGTGWGDPRGLPRGPRRIRTFTWHRPRFPQSSRKAEQNR